MRTKDLTKDNIKDLALGDYLAFRGDIYDVNSDKRLSYYKMYI